MPQRKGSPFTGLGPVFVKEFSDHLSSARMMVLMLFVMAFGAFPVASSLQELRNVTEADPFLFLRIFTLAPERLPISFVFALSCSIDSGDEVISRRIQRSLHIKSQPM